MCFQPFACKSGTLANWEAYERPGSAASYQEAISQGCGARGLQHCVQSRAAGGSLCKDIQPYFTETLQRLLYKRCALSFVTVHCRGGTKCACPLRRRSHKDSAFAS
eukprot:s98_g49.t1